MPRSVNSVASKQGSKKILKKAKGYYGKRKSVLRIAKQSVTRAAATSFAHRRKKKGDFRKLWHIRINAALHEYGLNYSRFVHSLKKANILLNTKSLAYLAAEDSDAFKSVVEAVSQTA